MHCNYIQSVFLYFLDISSTHSFIEKYFPIAYDARQWGNNREVKKKKKGDIVINEER